MSGVVGVQAEAVTPRLILCAVKLALQRVSLIPYSAASPAFFLPRPHYKLSPNSGAGPPKSCR
jgi:hypothetical protein